MAPSKPKPTAPTMDDLIGARAEGYAAAEARLADAVSALEAARQRYADAVQAASTELETVSADLAVARVDRDRIIREADAAFDEGTRALADAPKA